MTTRWILAGLIAIAHMGTASMLFLYDSPRAATKKLAPISAVEIKWGDS